MKTRAFTRRPVVSGHFSDSRIHGLGIHPCVQAAEQDATNLDEIVVTGIRSSLESSMRLKRDAQGVVDGIVAEDIGKFPDTNLAESLQRISGVSIDRSIGEGSKVTVRGVGPDFNLVLLNGRQMPGSSLQDTGASNSRSFDFANLASEAIAARRGLQDEPFGDADRRHRCVHQHQDHASARCAGSAHQHRRQGRQRHLVRQPAGHSAG